MLDMLILRILLATLSVYNVKLSFLTQSLESKIYYKFLSKLFEAFPFLRFIDF